jgi:transcription termination factor Rho
MPEQATISGIVKRGRSGGGVLLAPATRREVARIPSGVMRECGLVQGAAVTGTADASGRRLASVAAVCGLPPDAFRARPPFKELVAISPHERFDLGASEHLDLRLIDLVAPIGKGTRGLIVAPAKAGKTTVLEHLGQGIHAAAPATRIIVLLIDERPEEVTYFRRTAQAEVYASSSDQSPKAHVALAELMMDHIRTELECGNDVVVLVDSLTRLVRAVNHRGTGRASRTLSGGLDAAALQLPRRFFGLARAIEGGGSVTLLATLLVETRSRMDQVIYEEFKSSGNCEIVLSRELAQQRLYPALDLRASGTRKADRFFSPENAQRIDKLHRVLAARAPAQGLKQLINLVEQYPTNQEFLDVITL